ncbi:MAG: polysaccharide deacetylase family protein [Actinobacteria bacterium]|nr:MAG: polysaccharide deacetylase family protein [Actinomycetota bacterium]
MTPADEQAEADLRRPARLRRLARTRGLRRRRRLRRSRRVAAFAVVVLLGLALTTLASRPPGTILVTVAGTLVRVRHSHPTVSDALRAARMGTHDGALLSAVTHQVLDPHHDPTLVLLNGHPAVQATDIESGDGIALVDGVDAVEPVEARQTPISPGGLPPVERTLWRPGHAGVADSEVGSVSGEVVTSSRISAPTPAAPERANVVALTFDDGPSPQWTPQVLQILLDEGVKGTFCTVGYATQHYPGLVKLERQRGNAACDHTLHHIVTLASRPRSQIHDEIFGQADKLQDVLQESPQLYRPPGGSLSPDVISVAHERGLRVLLWDVDPHDYERPPAPVILQRILDRVRPGSVILMHDGGGDRSQTVAMLRPLIDQLKARGFSFSTPVDEPPAI